MRTEGEKNEQPKKQEEEGRVPGPPLWVEEAPISTNPKNVTKPPAPMVTPAPNRSPKNPYSSEDTAVRELEIV